MASKTTLNESRRYLFCLISAQRKTTTLICIKVKISEGYNQRHTDTILFGGGGELVFLYRLQFTVHINSVDIFTDDFQSIHGQVSFFT